MRIRSVALAIGLLLPLSSFGAPPPDIKIDPEIAAWFHQQFNPVTGDSCCDVSDGHVLASNQWRAFGNGFQIFIQGRWRNVPPDVVIKGANNPTGGAVGFWPSNAVSPIFCFILPAMG